MVNLTESAAKCSPVAERKAHWSGAAASAAAIESRLNRLLPIQCSAKLALTIIGSTLFESTPHLNPNTTSDDRKATKKQTNPPDVAPQPLSCLM